jgi:hypothetical protein
MVEAVLIGPLLISFILYTNLHLANKLTIFKNEVYEKIAVTCIESIFYPKHSNIWVVVYFFYHLSHLW